MNVAYDLFCGAGGASIGLHRAGYTVIGFDAWDVACQSHDANGYATVHVDLNDIDWSDWSPPDLLWASPPCQPFSAAGSHRGNADERDGMPAFLRAVEALQPPVVVMENVKGLTHQKHRRYLSVCTTSLMRRGYDVSWRVLNAADYGVPQTRERLILIARCDGQRIRWPRRTHSQSGDGLPRWVSMATALGWEGRVGFPRRYDGVGASTEDGYRARDWHSTGRPSPHVTEKFRSWVLNTGKDWKKGGPRFDAQQIPVDEPAPTVNGANGGAGMWWFHERPSTTVAGDPRIWPPGHKINAADIAAGRTGLDRAGADAIRVTEAEAAVLQGFPRNHRFCGSRTAQFQQIGNAVPPALAHAVVEALR